MSDPILWHRLQFGFTAAFHYIFPQLTMGLALLIVVMKWIGLRSANPAWNTVRLGQNACPSGNRAATISIHPRAWWRNADRE